MDNKPAPTPDGHVDFLDPMRGLAAFFVYVFHAVGISLDREDIFPFNMGRYGVAMFFAVSGFCIHASYMRGGKSWPKFWVRRFFRIYPPYLVAFILFAFLFPVTALDFTGTIKNTVFNIFQILTHVLLIQNIDTRFDFAINVVFWSIAVEAQLYLLYPVLLWIVRRYGWQFILPGLLVLELILRLSSGPLEIATGVSSMRPFMMTPFYFWFSWAIGAAVAENWLHGKPLGIGRVHWGFWILGAAVADSTPGFYQLAFPMVAMGTAAYIDRRLFSNARPKTVLVSHFTKAGYWCYSIYLLHVPLLRTIPLISGWIFGEIVPVFVLLLSALFWPLTLLLSSLFYRYIECPAIAAGKAIIKRLPNTIVAPRLGTGTSAP